MVSVMHVKCKCFVVRVNFAGMVDLVGSTMTARAVEGFWCWTVITYGVRASKNLSDGRTRRKEGRTTDFGDYTPRGVILRFEQGGTTDDGFWRLHPVRGVILGFEHDGTQRMTDFGDYTPYGV